MQHAVELGWVCEVRVAQNVSRSGVVAPKSDPISFHVWTSLRVEPSSLTSCGYAEDLGTARISDL